MRALTLFTRAPFNPSQLNPRPPMLPNLRAGAAAALARASLSLRAARSPCHKHSRHPEREAARRHAAGSVTRGDTRAARGLPVRTGGGLLPARARRKSSRRALLDGADGAAAACPRRRARAHERARAGPELRRVPLLPRARAARAGKQRRDVVPARGAPGRAGLQRVLPDGFVRLTMSQ
ncbi:hypothetical protein T492DRAFT_472379 [Pavlovales sp. CCMP2436]|nr:hypothetical protein T492DRAFT_472379 [Pavlovales sp. CCMP2436]